MNKVITDALACPVHKTALTRRTSQQTASGVIKRGALFCDSCGRDVATVRHGKVDFLRIDTHIPTAGISRCEEFYYKRLPWDDKSVVATNCSRAEVGWNSEGFAGCLQAGPAPEWCICIDTDATDLALRFLSHEWSGCVSVTVDSAHSGIDLYSAAGNQVNAYELFSNLPGNKRITIRQAAANPLSKGDQVYFFGMDAVFSGRSAFAGGNRGNGFPAAYKWVLDNLPPHALVLDCGSGDRKYPDERVVAFEYLPFELPDVFGDGHALPFADASFDAVFSQAVMEHMRDPYLAAREISRITKPGGLIYAESAFMQPLHAVPYHFFNTTTWGIEAIFSDANVTAEVSEWFGPISASVDWYLNACGGGGLTPVEKEQLRQLLLKVDSNVSYDQLKPIASAVCFWGIKSGAPSHWKELLADSGRPSFKYFHAGSDASNGGAASKPDSIAFAPAPGYGRLRSVVKQIIGKMHG